MHGSVVPLVVSLIIWGAVFFYLWRLDARTQELQRELDRRAEDDETAEGGDEES